MRRKTTFLERAALAATPYERARRFLSETIWQIEANHLPTRLQRWGLLALRVVYLVGRGFVSSRAQIQASSLTYTSMLALVPFFAVVFAIFQAYGDLQGVGERVKFFLIQSIAANPDQAKLLQEKMTELVAKAQVHVNTGSGIAGVAFIFLVVTIVQLLGSIEYTLNEIWGVKRAEGALQAALEGYGFSGDAAAALERMAAAEAESLILHEVGEARAEPLLGPAWREMLGDLPGRRAELLARAVRDNLADCLSTLPALIECGKSPALHFYFANFEGVRRSLFPRLWSAYAAWRKSDDTADLIVACSDGQAHWEAAALRLLAAWRSDPAAAAGHFSDWLDEPGPLAL